MIHDAAARAVGVVYCNGALNGHCVLIGRNLAVTCAHALTKNSEKPNQAVRLEFPRLGFSTQSARVVAWSAYDQSNTKGSDIAILRFEKDAPEGSWVSMEAHRPPTGADVVVIEYASTRADGDPREATIHYGGGDVISLAGEFVIDQGMSGTGLFYREPGERLLGLMASRPKGANQTEAYVIPADEILKLQVEACEGSVQNTSLPMFDGLAACFLAQVSDNFRPYLEEFVVAAREVIEKPPEDWTEADINDLLSLYVQIVDQGGTSLPSGLTQALAKLSDLMSEMAADARSIADSIPLDGAMGDALSAAQSKIQAFHASNACPEQVKQPTRTLLREIGCSLASKKLFPRKLSDSNAIVQCTAGEAYRQLGRGVPSILGMRPDLLPAGTIFTDSVAPWAPEMVVIPAGRYKMGANELDEGFETDEGPQRSKQMSKFAFSRFLVTFSEFDAFCNEMAYSAPRDSGWGRNRRPAIYVSFENASDFCNFLCQKTNANYRMPLESEWEYVCKLGETFDATFQSILQVDTEGRSWKNLKRTLKVHDEEIPKNKLGIHQMIGNLWQWCANEYSVRIPEKEVITTEVVSDTLIAARGGSWNSPVTGLRPTYRNRFKANYQNNDVGIRLYRFL